MLRLKATPILSGKRSNYIWGCTERYVPFFCVWYNIYKSQGGACLRKQEMVDYYVYIIKSIRKNWFYVGFTKNLVKRIFEHNKGYTRSTKSRGPFNLVFVQIVSSRKMARDFEKFLKIKFNKEALLEIM